MRPGIALRPDYDAAQLWALAKATRDAGQSRRLLALAEIYDGGSRVAQVEPERAGRADSSWSGKLSGRTHPPDSPRTMPRVASTAGALPRQAYYEFLLQSAHQRNPAA